MTDHEQKTVDYDVDKRYAHIKIELLGQEYSDVVRVKEQFPDLPDGITVYVDHVEAVDLQQENKENEEQAHTNYTCPDCGSNEWHIQNRVAPVAAYFDPKITHVECVNCGFVDKSKIDIHGGSV